MLATAEKTKKQVDTNIYEHVQNYKHKTILENLLVGTHLSTHNSLSGSEESLALC